MLEGGGISMCVRMYVRMCVGMCVRGVLRGCCVLIGYVIWGG